MKDTLKLLDKQLAELRPDYYAELNKGLNDFDMNAMEASFDIKIPKDLRALYKWRNGQSEDNTEALVNNAMFLPLHEALELMQEFNERIGTDFEIENWWNEGWIPLFSNGGGDYICYDTEGIFTGSKGQLIEFWHDANNRVVIANHLEIFLKALTRHLQETPEDELDEYFDVEEHLEVYRKEFKVE